MPSVARTRINANGRIVIPKEMREALGARPGDEVLLRLDEAGIVIYTQARALAAIRAELRRRVPGGVSLADELIADRRAEFEREAAEPAPPSGARRRRAAHAGRRS
jgi:AbrB family looped-hinge helix DNA binding protein